MKIIYEYHKGEDKVTIISESPDVTMAATEALEVLKILFPPTEIRRKDETDTQKVREDGN